MKFSVSILRHTSRWTLPEAETTTISGFPNDRLFNWKEGFEVLHFIERYMQYKGWYSTITFQKIESEIKTRLPFSAKTHNDVKVWLDMNFKK